jgi:hypothetical protein
LVNEIIRDQVDKSFIRHDSWLCYTQQSYCKRDSENYE